MKNSTILVFFLLSYCFGATQIPTFQTQLPQPIVTIIYTEPEQPIEGGLVVVYFRFTNRGANNLNGWIGAEMNSGTSAPRKSGIDWPITDLKRNQSVDGALMVRATDAGVGKKLRVYFYENQETGANNTIQKSEARYVIGEKEINIAALINFKLDNFIIHHTRAQTTDSDWGSLYATVDEVPVMDPASIFLGYFEDGTYPFKGKDADDKMIENFETGPIALVPGLNNRLHVAYTIYNGAAIEDRPGFLRGYAEATANPALFQGPRPGSSADAEWIMVLNRFVRLVGACDGFVVKDAFTINSNDIFSNMMGGNKVFNKRYNSEEYASQLGCGNTSDYEVNSSVERMREYQYSTFFSPLVFTKITAKKTIDINQRMEEDYKKLFKAEWQRVETIDRQGNFVEMNDGSYGYISGNKYYSPAQISTPLLVILRGSLFFRDEYMKQSPGTLNNGPQKQAIAIIQLIPGITVTDAMTTYTPPVQQSGKPNEDYGHADTSNSHLQVIQNYVKPFTVSGEWRYKITSRGGAVYTGVVNLQQNGGQVSGNLVVTDNTKPGIYGTYANGILNLTRDTGLETMQFYKLSKVSETYFSGTYENRGKYADSGTIEFFK